MYFKNKTFTNSFFVSLVLAASTANATHYEINNLQTTPFVLGNDDSLTVTNTGSLQKNDGTVLSATNVTAQYIENFGCIYGNSGGTGSCDSPVATDYNAIVIQNSNLELIRNNVGAKLGQTIKIRNSSEVELFENHGTILEDVDIYTQDTRVETFLNTGTIVDDFSVYDGGFAGTVTNSATGLIGDQFTVHSNPTSDATSIVETFNNDGVVERNIFLNQSEVTTINNKGDVNGNLEGEFTAGNDSITLQGAKITTLNNEGNIVGDIDLSSFYNTVSMTTKESSIQTLNNYSMIGGDIELHNDSKITTLNNSLLEDGDTIINAGVINGITISDNSEITTINNENLIGNITQSSSIAINQLNNSCDANINSINLSGAGGINSLNNSGFVGYILLGNSRIGNLNNLNGCNNASEIEIISLVGSTIDSINNYGDITNINIHEGSEITSLNNYGSIVNNEGAAISVDSSSIINISNSGLISGNGTAIDYGNGNDRSLTLNPGSTINGLIDFGTGIDSDVTVTGGYQPTRQYFYNGDFTLNAYDEEHIIVIVNDDETNPNFIVTNKPKTTGVDSSQSWTAKASNDIEILIASRLSSLRNDRNCYKRIDDDRCYEEVAYNEVAANEVGATRSDASPVKINNSKIAFWSEVFGSYNDRSSYKNIRSSESTTGGIIIGADKEIASNKIAGGFVGALSGTSDIISNYTNNISVSVDSKGVFAGGYLSVNQKSHFVDLSLITGIIENDSNRVNEDEVSNTSYNNIFISPTITIGKNLNLANLPIVVSGALGYTGQWLESSEETGAIANISTESKYLNSINARAKIETNNKGLKVAGGNFIFNVRTGVEANRFIGDHDVDASILGENIAITSNNRDYNVDGFVGLNTSYDLQDNVRIYADVEGSKGLSKSLSNNNLELQGKLGLRFIF